MVRVVNTYIIESESDVANFLVPSGSIVYMADGSKAWKMLDAWFDDPISATIHIDNNGNSKEIV